MNRKALNYISLSLLCSVGLLAQNWRPIDKGWTDKNNIERYAEYLLQNIAQRLNPLLRGWIEYYGRYALSALYPLLRCQSNACGRIIGWIASSEAQAACIGSFAED